MPWNKQTKKKKNTPDCLILFKVDKTKKQKKTKQNKNQQEIAPIKMCHRMIYKFIENMHYDNVEMIINFLIHLFSF